MAFAVNLLCISVYHLFARLLLKFIFDKLRSISVVAGRFRLSYVSAVLCSLLGLHGFLPGLSLVLSPCWFWTPPTCFPIGKCSTIAGLVALNFFLVRRWSSPRVDFERRRVVFQSARAPRSPDWSPLLESILDRRAASLPSDWFHVPCSFSFFYSIKGHWDILTLRWSILTINC
jgi:hypothetical protein